MAKRKSSAQTFKGSESCSVMNPRVGGSNPSRGAIFMWKKIQITFEMDRAFTDEERLKLLNALVEKAREQLGPQQGNLIRWTACCIPNKQEKSDA